MYVGKAKDLKKRVAYYKRGTNLHGRTKQLVATATQLKHQVLPSELEALLVEAELIRLHQPPFNVLLKDDKTPLYIHLTKEEFPRVLTIRKKDIVTQNPSGTIIGPLPSGYKVKEVLKIARKIFPWCNHRGNQPAVTKPCFYYHLDQCPGACIGQISAADYSQNITHLKAFLKGQKKQVVTNLKKEMQTAASNNQFETAAQLRDQIRLITEVTSRSYLLKPQLELPTLRLTQAEEAVTRLRKLLSSHGLLSRQHPIHRIEGYDVSNTQGTNAAVSMVTFIDGQPDKSEYRLFNIRDLDSPNDYAMMKQAISRRQNHPEWGTPDLLVIDGGKGQLRAALSVWQWDTPVISLVKRPDRIVIPRFTSATGPKTISNLTSYSLLKVTDYPIIGQLLQQIRDESHRFSKKQHTRIRTRRLLNPS